MKISAFGKKFTEKSGILELMEDLSSAITSEEKIYMLGGGNPARIPALDAIWKNRVMEIMADDEDFNLSLTAYDSAGSNFGFASALAAMFNREYGWDIGPENIGVTNGSQIGFFLLFNLFSGRQRNGRKQKIMLPLCPEYVGYADQPIEKDSFISRRAKIVETGPKEFKYFVDFDNLEIPEEAGALCSSRPTNPTGNVLTDEEVKKLSEMAGSRGIPLLLDNAYGAPFPNIIFQDVKPIFNDNIVLSMSLSKLGLPSTRTGIIIAREEIIQSLSAVNAIVSLANTTMGQLIVRPLIQSGKILDISRKMIMPYYKGRSEATIKMIEEAIDPAVDYRIHKSEGAIFLWIWFKNLKISARELYERLKRRNVIVLSGEHFFFGLEEAWEHSKECIRLNYSGNPEAVEKAVEIIAEEALKGLD
ncbi:MAG: valine--pyruvate transaminase [Spirochaetales bacterium]|nr:valine--pyruvate transaminase [Spirochaetales bacterium]